jgi:flagellar motor switch protein FliN/FliY
MAVVRNTESPSPSPADGELRRILNVRVPVIVRLAGRDLAVGEVMKLSHGSILEMQKHCEEPLHLMVNNQVIGEGEAIKVGENFGLRLTAVGDLRDRVEAMGS